ncbi:hypothetical protein CLAFUW4_09218 [Fulvia fulva]|uniref:Uncharacterized protein n=1 Tax=Passalora fulva TaxID=5499 RepID=A0A9Q8UT83_PASFU|nr:uncharacterized protein CLAFUR5_09319 [Fulvia fulva]KAK4613667.1 hypothetical protein CLAFUR4_09224 [Fulvia fulva]KAK4614995.1 hypothetical protein CLAFUR0_09216 [Fulvia fulva]UJO21578.1 hypothetical protein CLAFUR5_09319 [Fulvia fulva]WPV20166.1 hypothetical protein CLAFUW4_09218 [Fulvia fulva]WPV35557.1 hypothetical protein CLAFUW7_09219 [Fulvia fulva]
MAECFFLTRLPAELRVQIYEHILAFQRPLKLRQVVAGAKNTSVLRANRQIHSEALPVFFDLNIILATRNDFCEWPDSQLQTPIRRDQVRHLLVKHFGQSIRCSSFLSGNNMVLPGCCRSCHPSADGFIEALSHLPRLQTAVIDYHHHQREFGFIKATIEGIGSTNVYSRAGCQMTCIGIGKYQFTSGLLPPAPSITFTDSPLNYIWNRFSALESLGLFGVPEEKALLEYLRDDMDRALPDKLYLLHCARHSVLWLVIFQRVAELWQDVEDDLAEGRDPGASYEALTQDISGFMARHSVQDARMQLQLLRAEEARLQEWQSVEPQLPALAPEDHRGALLT